MENKYYTPEIEEFHVGFEYELKTEGEWVNRTLDIDYSLNRVAGGLANNTRVKHLDREDIESFRFELNDIFKENTEKDLYYNSSVMTPRGEQSVGVYHVPQTMWCMIFFGNKNDIGDWSITTGISPITVDFHTNTAFAGQIRNRSELKRVLTQIGVI